MDTNSSVLTDIGTLYVEILSLLKDCGHPAVLNMLDELPTVPGQMTHLQAASMPVLSCLPAVSRNVSPQTRPAMQALHRVADHLRWNQTYTDNDVSADFLQNYAWGVVASPEGPVKIDAPQIALLVLGPHMVYPPHRHGPEEAYYVIGGGGEITIEDGNWEPLHPQSVVYNPPWQIHGIRTADDPIIMISLFQATMVPKSTFS